MLGLIVWLTVLVVGLATCCFCCLSFGFCFGCMCVCATCCCFCLLNYFVVLILFGFY